MPGGTILEASEMMQFLKENRKFFPVGRLLAVIAVLVAAYPACADYSRLGIPDSRDVRERVLSTWLEAPVADIRARKPELMHDDAGNAFQVRAEESGKEIAVIIAPECGDGSYPPDAPGSWVLFRENAKNGKPLRLKLYFNKDSAVHAEFRNGDNKTFGDMIVFGCYAARSVPVGVSFRNLYTLSFDEVVDLTSATLPWAKVTAEAGQYESVLHMVDVIRTWVPHTVFSEDACYNEDGALYSIRLNEPLDASAQTEECASADEEENVYIKDPAQRDKPAQAGKGSGGAAKLSLSNAGFVKWVADGIIEPATGTRTKISQMKSPTVNYNSLGKNGVTSQEWNISFTLDWCRNLAVEALNARSSRRTYVYKMGTKDATGVDVDIKPFVADISGGNIVRTTGYTKDTGYSLRELKALLYVLAVTEPRYIYFGAIKQYSTEEDDVTASSRTNGKKAAGKSASDFVFNSCVVFMPYFDDEGRFNCRIFSSGTETDIDSFVASQKNAYVHLERVKSAERFAPR